MASAPKIPGLAADEEAGRPRVFDPSKEKPKIKVIDMPAANRSSKSPEEEANIVLQRAFRISPSAKNVTVKGGLKKRSRKNKKHARKTRKHRR